MILSKQGYCEIGMSESLALQVYLDSGDVRTVSMGLTASDIPDLNRWSFSAKMSIEEAVLRYVAAMNVYVAAVNRAITRLDIPQNQFDALVSFTYNCGIGAFNSSTLLKRVNANAPVGDIVLHTQRGVKPQTTLGSILEALCKDVYVKGVVVEGLINRREHEALLFRDGKYQSNGAVGVYKVDPITHRPSHDYNINLLDYL